jgi:hypothetical protein
MPERTTSISKSAILYTIFAVFLLGYVIAARLFFADIFFNSKSFYYFSLLFYALLLFIFLGFTVFTIKKNIFTYYSDFILFMTIFLYSLLWITQGFDLTDEGFVLSKSWFLVNGLWEQNTDFIWGSSLAGGIWLKIVGAPFLLWERIGYCLIIALMGLFIYKILRNYFEVIYSFVGVLLISVFIRMNIPTINYNCLPGLLAIVGVFFFVKSLNSRDNGSCQKFYFILSGAIFGFSIFSRFSNIAFLVVPLIFFTLFYWIAKDEKILILRGLGYTYLGFFLGIVACIGVFFLTNTLKAYFNNISYMFLNIFVKKQDSFGQVIGITKHSFSGLMGQYIKDAGTFLKYLAEIFIPGLFFYLVIMNIKNDKIRNVLKIIIYICFGSIFMYIMLKERYTKGFYFVLIFMFINATIVLIKGIDFKANFIIIFWSLFLSIFPALGSDLGIRAMLITGGVGLFFCVLFVLAFKSEAILENRKVELKLFLIIMTTILFVSGIYRQYQYAYRDHNRSSNNVMMDIKVLNGVFSSKARKLAVEGLVNFTKTLNDFNKKDVYAANSQPLVYFLLNHRYSLFTPLAPWTFLDDNRFLKSKINELKKENKLPEYIIMSYKHGGNNDWPETKKKYGRNRRVSFNIVNKLTKSCYLKIFSNNGYTVFKKSIKLKGNNKRNASQ